MYKSTYAFNNEHREDLDKHDWTYHFKRDKNTIYNEAHVKMKPHLRK